MDYNFIITSIFIILILLTTLTFAIILFIEHRNGEKIKRKVYELGKNLTEEKAKDYIEFVDNVQVPHMKMYYDVLKAGHILIFEDKSIRQELKEELRKAMLSRGMLI